MSNLVYKTNFFKLLRHSEGVSYHDGPSNRSKVIREDTDFLDSNVYKINSTGTSMFIRYYSAIEQPRVYGFLLSFHCIPTASTVLKSEMYKDIDSSDQDCFIEDNTIEPRSTMQSRSWRIPGSGNRHYKKMPDSRVDFDRLPHAASLKKGDYQVHKKFQNKNNWDFRYNLLLK